MADNLPYKMKNAGRRDFIKTAAGASLAVLGGSQLLFGAPAESRKIKVCIFSKHLQWLDYQGMAETAAEAGFDGISLTVRQGGHVLPERVEEDLPKAIEAMKKTGLEAPMITSGITDPGDPATEKILKTASALGVAYYRLGYYRYRDDVPVLKQIEDLKPKMRELGAMNAQYKITGCNHNHSGAYIGASLWDEWELLKDIDSPWLGFKHDVWHAWNEGRGGSWRANSRLIAPRTKLLAIKTQAEWSDPAWRRSAEKDESTWQSPAPESILWLLRLMKEHGFSGHINTMYEYSPLGGAEHGAKKLEGMSPKELIAVFKRNLSVLRGFLTEAELD